MKKIGYVVIQDPADYAYDNETVISSGNTLYPTAARAIIDNAEDFRRDEERFKVASVYVEDDSTD